MRLRELRFHSAGLLDADLRVALNRRVTLVLGDNEAGKSSMRRAIDALLFGPTQALVAPASVATFDCSASVETAADTRATIRRRGRNWAIAPSGALLALLAPELAGRFRDMFCLSHENLHPDAAAFLGADGTLGSLLFGASTGLRPQALEAALRSLERELRSVRSSGAGGSLERCLEEFRAAREHSRHIARFHTHEQASSDFESAHAHLLACDVRVADIDRHRRHLERLLGGVATWQRLADARAELARLEGPERLPDAMQTRELAALRVQLEILDTQAAERALQELDARAELDRCELPGPLAELAPAIESLREAVAAFDVDRHELARELGALTEVQAELHARLRELGVPAQADPLASTESLLLPHPAAAVLESALDAQRELAQARASRSQAQAEAEEARRAAARQAAERQLQDSTAIDAALPLIETAMRAERDLATLAQALRRKSGDCSARLRVLGLRRAAESDAAIQEPDRARTATLQSELAQTRAEFQQAAQRLEAADTRLRSLVADRLRLRALLREAPTDARLAEARERRDELWNRLRAHWTPVPVALDSATLVRDAQAFEHASQQLDLLHTARIAAGESVAAAQATEAAQLDAELALQDVGRDHEVARGRVADAEQQWAAHWALLAAPPVNAGEWYARLDAWSEARRELAELRQRMAELREVRDTAIADGLAHLGAQAASFSAFASAAALHAALLAESRRQAACNDLARESQQGLRLAEDALARLHHQLEKLAEAEAQWQAGWNAHTGLLPACVGVHPAAVRNWLDAQPELRRLCVEWRELSERIELRRKRAAGVEARIGELLVQAKASAPELPIAATHSPPQAFALLREAALAAQARLHERRQREQLLAQVEHEAAGGKARQVAALEQLRRLWDALGYREAPAVASIAARLDTATRAAAARQQVEQLEAALEAHWGEQRAGFEAQLQEHGESRLRSELQRLHLEAQAASEAQDAARQVRLKASLALDELGADHDAVGVELKFAAARDRVLDEAERLHRLALASHLLERAKAQATRSQIHLEQRASGYFATLTAGAFSGLRIDATGNTLYALGTQGDKALEQLSTGSRDQIWLALRLATIAEAARHTPFPLVLDDIFVQFDDERSSAALRLLLELSTEVQVIAFTHHEHVADLAQAVLPAEHLDVVTLPRPDGQARVRILEKQRERRKRGVESTQVGDEIPGAAQERSGFDEEPGTGAGSRDIAALAGMRAWILEVLAEAAAPMSHSQFSERAAKTGLEFRKPVWQAAIEGLLGEGRIERSGEKRGTRYALRPGAPESNLPVRSGSSHPPAA